MNYKYTLLYNIEELNSSLILKTNITRLIQAFFYSAGASETGTATVATGATGGGGGGGIGYGYGGYAGAVAGINGCNGSGIDCGLTLETIQTFKILKIKKPLNN